MGHLNINLDELDSDCMVDELFTTAQKAARKYSTYSTAEVDKILSAVGNACNEKAEFYAKWAVEETGFGDVESKIVKNKVASLSILDVYKPKEFIDAQVDHQNKVVKFPKPAGIIVALLPCTNPVATVYYKSVVSLMTRNVVILCPHPAAKECSIHSAEYLAEVAENAGAPKGAIQVLREPSVSLVNRLMQDSRNNLTLATGGPGMVQAAYSSGRPAIGVGAGNVVCYVHESADIEVAGPKIVQSNSIDNALPCTAESFVLADHAIANDLRLSLENGGGFFVKDENEENLREVLFDSQGMMNPTALGKSAQWLENQAGFSVPSEVKSLIIEIEEVGPQEPVSKEKMFPVIGFMEVDGPEQAVSLALNALEMMGKGHSAAIHCDSPDVAVRYAQALPVCRISVNAVSMLGSAGFDTGLCKAFMVGTGFFGGGTVDDNVGPKYLVQWTRLAYSDGSVMGDVAGALE